MNQDDIILESFATDLGEEKGCVFRILSDQWLSQKDIVGEYKRRKLSVANPLKRVCLGVFYELDAIMILSSLEQQDEVIEGKSEEGKDDDLKENVIYFRRKTVDELAKAFEDYEPPPPSIFDIIREKVHRFFSR